jgi:hypothetical protein
MNDQGHSALKFRAGNKNGATRRDAAINLGAIPGK